MNVTTTECVSIENDLNELSTHHDKHQGILWYFMRPTARPSFTVDLLQDLTRFQQHVKTLFETANGARDDIRFLVAGSRLPNTFNLGGDLSLFMQCIQQRDRERLTRYATSCIDVLHANAINLDLPVTTISLVQGDALGGGFEAALSSNVLIAERSAQMGLPEVLFNLFPGMGAYSFLSRRLDAARAERMILSGRTYGAEELYDMGLVDVLAEDGAGEEAVYTYVKKQRRCGNATRAIHKVRQRVNPITYEELIDVTLLWVDAALALEAKDLRIMERLVKAQDRMHAPKHAASLLEAA